MKAMVLEKLGNIIENPNPLRMLEVPTPEPREGEILIKVIACGVCHTELDEIEGRTPPPRLPVILGHEVVGMVERLGKGASKHKIGDRVGVAWLFSTCGKCKFCRSGRENLCPEFRATGRDANGGYAQFMVVPEDSAYPIPPKFGDFEAAPLLCAGVIGYRSLRLTGIQDGESLGLFGFGASAHIVLQLSKYLYPNSEVFVFTRPGQKGHQELAKKLGADWVGATGDDPPKKLSRAIDFTPAWTPIVEGLRVLERGGRLVINAIRKENRDREYLLNLDYASHLWLEKELKSVANVTRRDALEFLPLAEKAGIRPEIQLFELEEANKALTLLKEGKIQGAAVLRIPH